MARLLADGEVVAETPLVYAGESSTYQGDLPLEAAGEYQLEVLAMDAANANFGIVSRPLVVRR